MFRRPYKYDVAISVAEEDRQIAEQITAELKRYKIRYYYYKERAAENWGEYIIHLTHNAYGKRSRFVLLITSGVFVQKYWSDVELQVALSELLRRGQHILQLQLDSTPVDGISKRLVSVNWNNNPAEIADLLAQKIKPYWRARRRTGLSLTFCFLVAGVLAYNFLLPARMEATGRTRKLEKVGIAMPVLNTSLVDSFYISSTEVTVTQFKTFCESQHFLFPSQPSSSREGGPVRNVTWAEASAFCKWSGGRLPTESEWEYAALGGEITTYSGGNNASKVAIYNRMKPDNVAERAPNQFGLYDMTGNVAEWCEDWYDASLTFKVVRGGAYSSTINPVNELDVRHRGKERPDNRSPDIGFRVVWDKKD